MNKETTDYISYQTIIDKITIESATTGNKYLIYDETTH